MQVLGIDEAGRGSLFGPLVVGGFLVASDRLEALRTAGARDSKALSPAARERVYAKLGALGQVRSVTLPPSTVDRFVARGALNELEAGAFARLVRLLRPDVAVVDACDTNAARFGRSVARRSGPGVRILARHHADRDHPVVGAASIVAKVRRDRALARLAKELRAEIGSGYPSDPKTVDFARRTLAGGGDVPPWMRGSWATVQRVKPPAPAFPLESFGSP